MESSKKIVTISILTILLISIIVSVIGWNFRTYDSRFSNQSCSREGKYCIYNNIPTGMMYTRPEQSLANIQQFEGDLSNYVTPINNLNYPEGISIPKTERVMTPKEFYIWDINNYKCISTNKTPEVIEYFAEFCGSRMKYQCENERRAIVCGTGYIIQETQEYQSKLYGPYTMPELVN